MHISRANSVRLRFHLVRDLFTPRRLSDNCQLTSFLARRCTNYIMQHVTRQVALWSANMQVADAFRKKNEFYPFLFFFFLGDFCSIFNTCNNSDQWNSQDQNFWKKCWNYEFLGSSIIKQIIPYILLPISHTFMCRVRSLWYAKTVDTFQLRSIHAHWPSSLVYWRWISYLVESFNFVKKYSSFFFFILIVWSYDCNERNIYICLCIIYIVR